MMLHSGRHSARHGFALVAVLFFFFLVSVVALVLFATTQDEVVRTGKLINKTRAEIACHTAAARALAQLHKNGVVDPQGLHGEIKDMNIRFSAHAMEIDPARHVKLLRLLNRETTDKLLCINCTAMVMGASSGNRPSQAVETASLQVLVNPQSDPPKPLLWISPDGIGKRE
jgi:Tfp pilus assembly protein PilX